MKITAFCRVISCTLQTNILEEHATSNLYQNRKISVEKCDKAAGTARIRAPSEPTQQREQ
jgi:hypothetical protein